MSLIALCSGKGAPGVSFCAVNLAAALGRAGASPLLVDCDPAGGDIGAYLALDPRRGLHPLLATTEGPITPERLRAEVDTRHGFAAIAGFLDPCPPATARRFVEVAQAARECAPVVVCDLGRLGAPMAEIAARAEVVLVVVEPTIISVLGAGRALQALGALEVEAERIRLVLNAATRAPADRLEVAQVLRAPIGGVIRRNTRAALRAMRRQQPIADRSLCREFDALAAVVVPGRAAPRAEILPVRQVAGATS